jgi:hypothetical protein
VQAGGVNGPKDWIEFLVVRAPSLLDAYQSLTTRFSGKSP